MEGDWRFRCKFTTVIISIHTLRMEGDIPMEWETYEDDDFNPHPPHGG